MRDNSPAGVPRGVALVEYVIQHIRVAGSAWPTQEARPLPGHLATTFSLGPGQPAPPSLQRWLAHDAAWIEWFPDLASPVIRPRRLREMMGPRFASLEEILPGACYPLRPSAGDTSLYFLYVGQADEWGEYPVFVADTDDWYLVALAAPGFDVYLAQCLNLLPPPLASADRQRSWFDHLLLGAAMRDQALRNFRGYRMCEIFGYATSLEGTATQWKELEPRPDDDRL
jgi:hypothetical protein